MSGLLVYISKFGLPTVAAAVLLYILINGDLTFRYPRGNGTRQGTRPRRKN